MKDKTAHSAEEGVAEKFAMTDKSDTEIDTEAGGEASTSQLHSRHKNGHMTNVYPTNSDEEAIVDVVKYYQELDDKNNGRGLPTVATQ